MGTNDIQNLKSEADILARQSRPQHSSTWIPKTRDWRCSTGVIQHDDFQDAPKSRSVWDSLDYDYQASRDKDPQTRSTSTSGNGAGSEQDIAETIMAARTPQRNVSKMSIETPNASLPTKAEYKSMSLQRGAWKQVTRFTRIANAAEDGAEESYELTGLVVRFRFTGKNKAYIHGILERRPVQTPAFSSLKHVRLPRVRQNLTPPMSSPNTPATARTAETIHTPHTLDSIESLYAFPLFKRTWVDETYNFNVNVVRSKLRHKGTEVDDLGSNFGWYADAVPIDAIFPPGVPISAKEIHAFYPHHVRWKGVMLRLTHNDYRGVDIMGMQALFRGSPNYHTPPMYMNNYQRDIVKTTILGFKTTTWKGKGDRNLRTDELVAGPYIETMRKGYTLPTFEDLVRGLQYLPAGLDARGLTQCLLWYLSMRDTFTPSLELNVLHTQSLIRALREPLKPFGPQNLDRNALEEWRSKGTFDTVRIGENEHKGDRVETTAEQQRRTQLHLNLDEDNVSLSLTLPIRHVLTFPFLALHGIVGEAIKLGIAKAEMRQSARKGDTSKRVLKTKWASRAAEKDNVKVDDGGDMELDDTPTKRVTEELKKPYRIPKRSRLMDNDLLLAPKRPSLATSPRSEVSPSPQSTPCTNRSWTAPRTPSAYMLQQQARLDVYSRRECHARQPDQRRGGAYQHERRREIFGQGGQSYTGYGNEAYGNGYRR